MLCGPVWSDGGMTALVAPDAARWSRWAAMIDDYGVVDQMHGSGYWNLDGPPVATEAGCLDFVRMLVETSEENAAGTRVACSYFWIAETDGGTGDALVGFLAFRHRLNDFLLEEGGHIGYSVAPSYRRRGHASAALGRAVVDVAPALGLERVLVTCDDDNEPSRRTILANGGAEEDIRNGKRRFWIPIG